MKMPENDNPTVIITRPQKRGPDGKFYYSPVPEVSAYLSAATDASARVYDVPTGKKFRLKTVIATNLNAKVTLAKLTNGSGVTNTVFSFVVMSAANANGKGTVAIADIEGVVFTSDVYLLCNTYATGFNILVAGELDPDEDAS